MVSRAGRRAIVVAGLLAVGAGGAVMAHADNPHARPTAAVGGLAMSPVRIERTVAVGSSNVVTLSNHSKKSLDVPVPPRPWIQSVSGQVAPNRRATLSAMSVSEPTFALAAGASKEV